MKKIVLIFLFSLSINFYYSQSTLYFKIPDSLQTKSFQYLKNEFEKTLKYDSEKAELYANTILLKGKNTSNTAQTFEGYLSLYKSQSSPAYLDSILLISHKLRDFDNLSLGYLHKGNYYYSISHYSKSLENYLSARDYTKNDSDTYHITNFNIGLLKLELGNYREAQQLFLNYKKFLENKNQKDRVDYLNALYAIAYTYTKMNMVDLSDSYIKMAFEKYLHKYNGGEIYNNMLMVSGINQYLKQQYKQAIKTLEDVSKNIRNNSFSLENLAFSEYYAGMSLLKTNNSKYLDKFKTIDSITYNAKLAPSEVRNIYPVLIEHYKKAGDKEKQLFYIEHLLEFDSILNKNSQVLTTQINKNYDTPNLINEKEKLIAELDSTNSVLLYVSGIIGMFVIGLLILSYQNKKKINHYKQQAIIWAKIPTPVLTGNNFATEKQYPPITEKLKTTLSKELLASLSLKFEHFESVRGFLKRDITLDSLAKEFNTNRDYLSKSVKELKGKSFSQYINELRIHYLTAELKTDPNLQRLTIAGIAEEAGFNNTESFTNAFKKITGTLPSYYLKALKEDKINTR